MTLNPALPLLAAAALTLALAGQAAAQTGETPSYGYGRVQPAAMQTASLDIRRTARPDAEELAPVADEPAGEEADEPEEGAEEGAAPSPQPAAQAFADQTGAASWYGREFAGRRTANGEIFDPNAMTAAHPNLPMPSLVEITNLDNGRSVVVRVNDRGPHTRGRVVDVSHAAARQLGFVEEGEARVRVRYLGPAPRALTRTAAAERAPRDPDAPVSLRPPATDPLGEDDANWETQTPAPRPVSRPAPQQTQQAAARYVVQVGAFSDPRNAERVRAQLDSTGDVRVEPRGALQRVRVGAFATRDEAETMRARVAALGFPEAVVAAH